MLLKRCKIGATIKGKVYKNWRSFKVNFRRHKDPVDSEINYCNQHCIFWNIPDGYCKYNYQIDCEDFDTDNYSYVPC